jgi:NAD(P)-dependent dehydrogenase (short-subunit alcohol dehydrogenase family)
MKLKERVAVITGGAIGIGAETARLFSREGAIICLIDIDAEGGKETCRDIMKNGGSCTFYQADVSNMKQVEQVTKKILQDFPRIHILVNNAGIWCPGAQI